MVMINSLIRHSFRIKNTIIEIKQIRTIKTSNQKRGHHESPVWTDKLEFVNPGQVQKIPTYRVIHNDGKVINTAQEPVIDNEKLCSMYKCMRKLNVMDKIVYESQRQGRIAFYMTNYGEEGSQIGSASALLDDDLIYGQYRELGVLLWRGYTIDDFMNQSFGTYKDKCRGRQMPMHLGHSGVNFVTISSPLSTQMPQAVGTAYAFKRAKSDDRCCIVYFGDGAASEGDAHAAFNFAATLQVPLLFFCRNNGYAISTPVSEQYKGDGIAGRAIGYGISVIRVDGNDTLAVYTAMKAAREFTLSESRPVLVEAMTYRLGHHSTSDDSSVYRSPVEVKFWEKSDPLPRFKKYLESKNLWDETQEKEWTYKVKAQVLEAIQSAEKLQKPDWREMFGGVYLQMPNNLINQREYLANHLEKYKEHYPLEIYENSK